MRSRWRGSIAVSMAAALALIAPVCASAQESTDERARAQFRLAEAHYANGSFLEAAHGFEQAYELSNRPELLYNVYVAYRDAGDLTRSRDALRLYLERMPETDGASRLRARLEALERMTGRTAATSAGAATDSSPSSAGEPAAGPAGGAGAPVSGAEDTAVSAAAQTSAVIERGAAAEGEDSPSSALSPHPFVVAGAGAALLVAGSITGALALDHQSSLDETCVDRACPPEVDYVSVANAGRTLAIATDALWIGGGVVLAAGIAWLLADATSSRPAQPITAACMPEGCFVALSLDL